MPKTYAFINEAEGLVRYVVQMPIPPANQPDYELTDIFGEQQLIEMGTAIDITELDPMPEAGWTYINGVFAPWAPPPPTAEQLRQQRDGYLDLLDKVTNRHRDQLAIVNGPDENYTTTLTDAQYQEVLRLKETLRDLPDQPGFPTSVTWPAVPSFLNMP